MQICFPASYAPTLGYVSPLTIFGEAGIRTRVRSIDATRTKSILHGRGFEHFFERDGVMTYTDVWNLFDHLRGMASKPSGRWTVCEAARCLRNTRVTIFAFERETDAVHFKLMLSE